MKKILLIILSILFIFINIPQSFGSNIFRKEEKVEVDKTQPFFINIYSNNGYDINNDF